MAMIETLVIVLLIINFSLVFIIGGLNIRIKQVERMTKEMITLVGKSAMTSMGLGVLPGTSGGPKANIKNEKTNPLVG